MLCSNVFCFAILKWTILCILLLCCVQMFSSLRCYIQMYNILLLCYISLCSTFLHCYMFKCAPPLRFSKEARFHAALVYKSSNLAAFYQVLHHNFLNLIIFVKTKTKNVKINLIFGKKIVPHLCCIALVYKCGQSSSILSGAASQLLKPHHLLQMKRNARIDLYLAKR